MKLQNNITVFAGDTRGNVQQEQAKKSDGGAGNADGGKNKTFYAGDFLKEFPLKERIEQKKAAAQERAMKIVDDAWNADKQIDDEIARSKERIAELKQENKDILEIYGEEGRGLTVANNLEIEAENATIRAIRGAARQQHGMVDAQEQAEDVMAAARDQIIGMVQEEAKEHLDEEQEKREEQAEAIKEKKEEQEEIREKRDEKEEELEELMEDMPVKEAADMEQNMEDVKNQIQKVLNEAQLIADDIKGAAVDASV